MSEPIRLVIWDLDETFWHGTLTEGGIEYIDAHHNIIVELTKRGIMNSICSKNDIFSTSSILEQKGIWQYFIFPSIDWSSKGDRVRQIIENAQLRPQSVLFIDDNALNRAEAEDRNPGLRTSDEKVISSLLSDILCAGKPDPDMSRLKDYKLLERKQEFRQSSEGGNQAFLRESNINVEIIYDVKNHLDRAVELINRTNQLNFTKRRLPDDLDAARTALLAELDGEFTRRAGLVRVKDRFGDYGIVGFWAIEGHGFRRSRALHYCFSCRTLGMGVEQWVYDKLGRPDLTVVGDVVSDLNFYPDWINTISTKAHDENNGLLSEAKVLLRGGCEMEVLKHFFSFHSKSVESEFLYYHGPHSFWLSHIATLRGKAGVERDVYEKEIALLGYQASDFDSCLDSGGGDRDLIVLNFSADTIIPTYKHVRHEMYFASMMYGLKPFMHVETADSITNFAAARSMDEKQCAALIQIAEGLRSNFEPHPLTDELLTEMYTSALSAIDPSRFVVMVLPIENIPEKDGTLTNLSELSRVNEIKRQVILKFENAVCVEMADFVNNNQDLLEGSWQHYTKEINYMLFKRIAHLYESWKAHAAPPRQDEGVRFKARIAAFIGGIFDRQSRLKRMGQSA